MSATLSIIFITILTSYIGFTSNKFFTLCSLQIQQVLQHKDYKRLLTVIVVHKDWKHLLFNMLTLYFFGAQLEANTNSWFLLVVYVVSALVASMFVLFFNKNEHSMYYTGASGAVSGVVFSAIVYNPYVTIYFIPGFVFAIGYLLYSILSLKKVEDGIAHEGHIGGAVGGIVCTMLGYAKIVFTHYWIILAILIPLIALLYIMVKHPAYFFIENYFKRPQGDYTIDDKYNQQKIKEALTIDAILDKINEKGIKSLSTKERKRLDEYSKK